MYIYKITNKINGKVYIGASTKNDEYSKDNYMGSGILIKWLIQDLGKEHFDKEIIESNLQSIDDLSSAERNWIEKYNSIDPEYGYNQKASYGAGLVGHRIGLNFYVNEDTGKIIRSYTDPGDGWQRGRSLLKKCKCPFCGSEYTRTDAQIKRGVLKHCSVACSNKATGPAKKERYYKECKYSKCSNQVENIVGAKRVRHYCSKSCVSRDRVMKGEMSIGAMSKYSK